MDRRQWVSLERAARGDQGSTLILADAYEEQGARVAATVLRVCALDWTYPTQEGDGFIFLVDVTISGQRYRLNQFRNFGPYRQFEIRSDDQECWLAMPVAGSQQSWLVRWNMDCRANKVRCRFAAGKEHWSADSRGKWLGQKGPARYQTAANLLNSAWQVIQLHLPPPPAQVAGARRG